VLAILSALVEERTGLHYGLLDHEVLAEKAGARAAEAGFETLLDYYYFLRYDPAGEQELDRLIDALVVGETYFFRELAPLRHVADLAAALVAKGARPRIWSAACASGEEPLTLAMLLDERGVLDGVDLVASDLSPRALERARRGRYGPRSVRDGAPAALAARYLRRQPDGGYTVSPAIAAAVRFRRVNLHEDAQVAAAGPADVVLCRNVLIYFRDETAIAVVRRLAGALVPRGVLVVGVSESLLRFGTSLECEEHGSVFLYRKPA
jgi:chemotaxis protein methyltransferase CheR